MRKIQQYYFLFFLLLAYSIISDAKTIEFSGLKWIVRTGHGGAGPNYWSKQNVWVDEWGQLHLKISKIGDKWYSSEVFTEKPLGFGVYKFYIIGKVDQLDPNVVLGIFNYPTHYNPRDGSNEIDIEISRWGATGEKESNISFTVWPSNVKYTKSTLNFAFNLNGTFSTHGFLWDKDLVFFQSGYGHHSDFKYPILSWLFSPPDYENYIPQKPLPIHLNLWLLKGIPPKNNQPVEVIIKKFCYISLEHEKSNCD